MIRNTGTGPTVTSSAEVGKRFQDLLLLVRAETEEDIASAAQIGGEERHRRVGAYPEVPPRVEARVPEERDLVAEVVVGDELLRIAEVVLSAEPDDLDLVCVLSGKLPDL